MIKGFFGRADPVTNAIIGDIRLPRALLGLLVGGVLGMSGAALQGYLRNPLAEPSTLGLSNSAALGAAVALYFGFAAEYEWSLPLFAIVGTLVAMFVLIALSRIAEGALALILGASPSERSPAPASRWPSISRPIRSPRWSLPSGCSDRSKTGACSMSCWCCLSQRRASRCCCGIAKRWTRSHWARRRRNPSASTCGASSFA